jgi:RHS repeat-associated protein
VVLTQHFPVFGQTSPMEFTLQSYDLAGNLAQSKECSSSNGVVTVWATNLWTYDGLNRMATETIKDGASTGFGYNALGSLTNRAMPDGLNWSAIYNNAGQILSEQLTGGGLTSRAFTYSYYGAGNVAAGLLQTKTDGRGVAKTTTYDDFLRPFVISASGTNNEYNLSITNQYDRRGLLTDTVQAYASTNTGPQTRVSRAYDAYGRILTEVAYVGSDDGRQIDQVWDEAGRRVAANFPSAHGAPDGYTYQYQADGQMTQVAYGDSEYQFSYSYRDNGLLLSRLNGELLVSLDGRDGLGRVAHRTSKLGATAVLTESLNWRGDGRMSGYSAVRGDYTDARNFTYSPMARRLASESLAVGTSQQITNNYGIDFGSSGKLGVVTSAAQSGVFASTWSVPSSGGLDGLRRLSQAQNTLAERPATGRAIGAAVLSAKLNGRPVPLEYDSGNTNGTWRAQMPLCPGQNTFIVSATHPSLRYSVAATNVYTNLIAAADGISGSFDGNGNFTVRVKRDGSNNVLTTQTLVWDANDRLVRVTERDPVNSGYDWTAVYDPLGRRLRTTYNLILTNSAQPSPTVLDSWYDPEVEFLEFGVTLNGVDYWKIYGPDLSGRYGGMQGVGGLDAVLHEFPLSFGYSAIVSDQFGDVVGNVEGPLGEPDEESMSWSATRVSAYGPAAGYPALPLERNQIAGEFLLAPVMTWRGMRIDPTGLYCIGARYYDPEAGRFISADPMGFAGGSDLQSFCQGDPVNFFDPDGRLGVSTLSAYGKLGGLSDRMPFEYRLAAIMAQAGVGGAFDDLYSISGVRQTWASSVGPSVISGTFNVPEIRMDLEEIAHPDFSSAWGRAAFGTALIGLPAQLADAAGNLLPGKALLEDAIKTGIKGAGRLFAKEAAEEAAKFAADEAAKTIAQNASRGFRSFDELKAFVGSPGEGNVWHHIVEQSKVEQFGVREIHNVDNVIAIPEKLNADLNALYSSIRPDITGSSLPIRDWLKSRSLSQNYDFGRWALHYLSQ